MTNVIDISNRITVNSAPTHGVVITKGNQVLELDVREAHFVIMDALMALNPAQLAAVCQRASMFILCSFPETDEEGDNAMLEEYNYYMDNL